MANVLHVDDNAKWRADVKARLEPPHTVHSFEHLADAKAAAATQEFDYYVVDGSIDEMGDGLFWVLELAKKGKNVLLMSGDEPPYGVVPFLDKTAFGSLHLLQNFIR